MHFRDGKIVRDEIVRNPSEAHDDLRNLANDPI
jgi:hypothetical protein